MRARRFRNRHNFIQLLCQLRHLPVIVVSPAHVNKLRGLILNGLDDFGVTMTRGADCDAGVAIEEGVSVDVLHPNALRSLGDKFEVRSWVSRVHVLSVGGNNLPGIRAGQFGFYLRPFWCNSG